MSGARRANPAAPTRTPAQAASQAALEQIWAVVAAVPRGSVTTYGAVAAAAGMPRHARFVVRALKLAPAARRLPWHRVVAAGGRIAFPAGGAAFREQARRLAREGVRVEGGRVAVPRAGDLDALVWGPSR